MPQVAVEEVRPPSLLPARAEWPDARGDVVGKNERLLVYMPRDGDTFAGIATRFLGDASAGWRIADANGQRGRAPHSGTPLVVPLVDEQTLGVSDNALQLVPVLCYHRFGPRASRMTVTPEQFEAQLEWLAQNDYRVIRLAELADFLSGKRALPQRAVVITIDDGYESTFRHAFPLLKKYAMPATLFIYTDFIGARDAMSWAQLRELATSGLFDIQAHSKSHRSLIERIAQESDLAYRHAVENEVLLPRIVLEGRLQVHGARVLHFAYPYGDANETVLDALKRHGYQIGTTVDPGGNPFFAHPLMLRRTMIFGDQGLDEFRSRIVTERGLSTP